MIECPEITSGRHLVTDWELDYDDDCGEFMSGPCVHCGMTRTRKVNQYDTLFIPYEWWAR
jgi:hypothetical protein